MQIEIRNLRKCYGEKVALKDLSMTLNAGVHGLLGPNGAGKSTLMDILTGNKRASAGQILCDGVAIEKLGKAYRKRLGYMPQQQALYPGFTAYDFLAYVAALKEMKKVEAKVQIEQVLRQVELWDVAGQKIGSFSGGMKQRLLIAQAMLGSPEFLILDEPTAGLDPKQRVIIRNLIADIARDKIVLLATHVVSDVEQISDQILLLRKGELVRQAPCQVLMEEVAAHAKPERFVTLEDVYLYHFGEE